MFATEPNRAEGHRGATTILRVKPRQRVVITNQSSQLAWAGTHWIDRQLWCPGEDCPACESYKCRVKGYFLALIEHPTTPATVLCEITTITWSKLRQSLESQKITWQPGLKLEAIRHAKNKGYELHPLEQKSVLFPELGKIEEVLSAAACVSGLPKMKIDETKAEFEKRLKPIAKMKIIEAMKKKEG